MKRSRVRYVENVCGRGFYSRDNKLKSNIVLACLSYDLLIHTGLRLQVSRQRSAFSAKCYKVLPKGCANQVFLYRFVLKVSYSAFKWPAIMSVGAGAPTTSFERVRFVTS